MLDRARRDSVRAALNSWDRAAVKATVDEADVLQQEFVERFPISEWRTMPLSEYALGQSNQDTVSWWVEYKTKPAGSMKGGSAYKHLIFRSADGRWRFPTEYEDVDQAWAAVRTGFVEMLDAADHGRIEDADDIKVLTSAPALRAKLLYLYFPDLIPPVASKTHIDHFLRALTKDPEPTVVRANRQLLAALRDIPELQGLTTQGLGQFVYHWNNPTTSHRVVKIAPGELGRYWRDCLSGGYICVGWDEVGDLSHYGSKEEFRESFRSFYPYNGVEQQVSRKANELWTLMELQPGDQVIANRGTKDILGVGTVNEVGYKWRPDRAEYRHTLGIDWDTSKAGEIPPVKAWATTTISKVAPALARQILGTPAEPRSIADDPQCLEIEAALKRRGQTVLYGPPGTGKTYVARRAAVWLAAGGQANSQANALLSDEAALRAREQQLMEPKDGRQCAQVTRVTFHPSYAYEDFIEGFRPQQSTDGTLQLKLTDGIFKKVCRTADADPANTYIVVIDELNRGNVPKILGELITLIEKDKRGMTVQLSQSGDKFSVPPNVFLICTMNTADRSIHLLDTALRRRFQFIEVLPDSNLLEGRTAGALALDTFLDGLNDEISRKFGRDKQIGHSLFYQDDEVIDSPEEFAAVFRYELLPLLQEYLYDDYAALADLLGEDVIDSSSLRISDAAEDPAELCRRLAGKFGSASA
ncbi:AAA family ATPase [Mycolicibacterium brumae]|nr:AAA family ATPase [Mycolicibacterium brumae]MCV7194040.1 AAA family ATPase [Mycolicibacterium brumae]UWW09712.1 AAA family ATPase [Mycolicibacterium brumae]